MNKFEQIRKDQENGLSNRQIMEKYKMTESVVRMILKPTLSCVVILDQNQTPSVIGPFEDSESASVFAREEIERWSGTKTIKIAGLTAPEDLDI